MIQKLKILALFTMLIFALSGCGNNSLVGRWEATSVEWFEFGEPQREDFASGEIFLTFFADGTGAILDTHLRIVEEDEFIWSTDDNNTLTLKFATFTDEDVLEYHVSGSTLTLIFSYDWDGEIITEISTFRRLR